MNKKLWKKQEEQTWKQEAGIRIWRRLVHRFVGGINRRDWRPQRSC